MMNAGEAARWLREHDDYLILTHRRPDGDTVGSAAALCRGLRLLGKKAELFPNCQLPEKFAPCVEDLLGSGDPTGKTLISVDLAAENMLPCNAPELAGRTEFAVDHHASNTGYAPNTFVEPEAAACGELVYAILQELGVTPDEKIAEALYIAVSTDTGCFRFANTTARSLRTAAACMAAGADIHKWNRLLFLTRTPARLRLEAYLTEHTAFHMDGKVALCSLSRQVVEDCGAGEEDMDDISGFPRDIAGVEIGVLLREVADGIKISLRTYAPWNASDICALLGGGGHANAAGATVRGTVQEAALAVLEALRRCGAEV